MLSMLTYIFLNLVIPLKKSECRILTCLPFSKFQKWISLFGNFQFPVQKSLINRNLIFQKCSVSERKFQINYFFITYSRSMNEMLSSFCKIRIMMTQRSTNFPKGTELACESAKFLPICLGKGTIFFWWYFDFYLYTSYTFLVGKEVRMWK
jgi:hypothetical protein